jgi:hypothetical protein
MLNVVASSIKEASSDNRPDSQSPISRLTDEAESLNRHMFGLSVNQDLTLRKWLRSLLIRESGAVDC